MALTILGFLVSEEQGDVTGPISIANRSKWW